MRITASISTPVTSPAVMVFVRSESLSGPKSVSIVPSIEKTNATMAAAQYFLEYSSSFFQLFVKFFERSPPDESLAPGPPAKPPDGFAAFSFL